MVLTFINESPLMYSRLQASAKSNPGNYIITSAASDPIQRSHNEPSAHHHSSIIGTPLIPEMRIVVFEGDARLMKPC